MTRLAGKWMAFRQMRQVKECKVAHFQPGWVDWGDDYTPPPVSWRQLEFIDDTRVGVFGLDETLAELFSEGWQANDEAAAEIIKRLEAHKNYIPASERAHKEYAYILLKEYKKYIKEQAVKKKQ